MNSNQEDPWRKEAPARDAKGKFERTRKMDAWSIQSASAVDRSVSSDLARHQQAVDHITTRFLSMSADPRFVATIFGCFGFRLRATLALTQIPPAKTAE